jgi:hypothetical protein
MQLGYSFELVTSKVTWPEGRLETPKTEVYKVLVKYEGKEIGHTETKSNREEALRLGIQVAQAHDETAAGKE